MIEIKDIEKLSQLARIHLAPEEKDSLAKEIDSILAYVAQIQSAGNATKSEDYQRNVMRDDDSPHESAAFTAKLLEAAPSRQGDYFKVKKILN